MSIPDPANPDSLVGQLIDGRYRISREIAVGGMGVVYEAKHAKIGRSVAVKVLHREMAGDSEVVGRFLNEARAMGTIGHPNIVACTDFGELPGHLPFLVLEYLEGKTLGEEIATTGPMPVGRALRICVQVASALEAAHSRGVIHRDLTSGNVFLTKTDGDWDHAKVLDFGISKFLTATENSPKTRRGFTMGTPEFMAPEQITHPDVVDGRVDVYALGVILYHMLAGKTPFGSVSVQTLFLQVVNELPPHIERADIPAEVLGVLDKALSKNPADRYADMKEMGRELEILAPPPMLGGAHSGRVEAAPSTAGTGSRPILRSTTAQQKIGPKSGAYAAARRTSLVAMAALATTGEQAAPRKSRKALLVGLVGLAAAAVVGWLVLGRAEPGGSSRNGSGVSAVGSPRAGTAPAATSAPPAHVRLQVFSSAPSARVTFRGRAHQIPFSEEVGGDSKLELVEITAPGREGRRYWLTMDRAMQLTVDLAPGRGVIEATTEEALVALGERNAEPSPAAPPPSDPADGKHSSSSSSHRSTARGKAVVAAAVTVKKGLGLAASPAEAPSIEPPSAAPAVPPPSAAKATALAPEPVVAATQAAAPEPTPPPAPVKASPAPAHAAAVAAPPPATPRAPSLGTIDAGRAQLVFNEHAADVQRCHQRAKIDNSDIRGKLTLKIAIGPSGQVIGTTVETSNLHNGALEACIASAVKGWPFPAPMGGAAALTHVFVLR